MSLLARGSQAADSPWAESAERGHSLLGVLRGETPWAGYRGGVLIGTGQSPGPRQSPQLRKAQRVVIVGYNRPAFLSPTRSRLLLFPSFQPFRDLRSNGSAYGSGSSGAGDSEVEEAALCRSVGQEKGMGQLESPQSPSRTPSVTASNHKEMKGREKEGMTSFPFRSCVVGIK